MNSCVPFVVSQVQKELDKAMVRSSPFPTTKCEHRQCRIQCQTVQGVAFFWCQIPVAAVSFPSKLRFQFASDMTISPKLQQSKKQILCKTSGCSFSPFFPLPLPLSAPDTLFTLNCTDIIVLRAKSQTFPPRNIKWLSVWFQATCYSSLWSGGCDLLNLFTLGSEKGPCILVDCHCCL